MPSYFILDKATGAAAQADSPGEPMQDALGSFFELIEATTGLTRVTAQRILDAGKPIDTPDWRFTAR